MNQNIDITKIEDNLEHYVDVADQRVAEFEEVLGRLVIRLESIGQTMAKIFARAKEQKDHLLGLKDKAVEAVTPMVDAVAPAAEKTRDAGRKLAARYKEDPRPFLVGGALILGGVLLTAYLMRDKESPFVPTLGDNSDWKSNENDIASAS